MSAQRLARIGAQEARQSERGEPTQGAPRKGATVVGQVRPSEVEPQSQSSAATCPPLPLFAFEFI